jgi:NAD(P)-dependent dehydrogenase (short-subunit alcohol dehydrogenase family)
MAANRRIAIITGAGSGIGKAAALSLGRRGYGIVLAGRRRTPLESVAKELIVLGAEALPICTDVTDEGSVEALFAQAVAQFGRVDLLFNNAGIAPPTAGIEDVAAADWRSVIDINLTGAFYCLRGAFRTMKTQRPRGGRIINNGSLSAHVSRPNSIAYTASKHAMTGLTRGAALEGRQHDIAVGQIDIGNAASDMTHAFGRGTAQADGSTKSEPTMNVESVGETIAYMDSLPMDSNALFVTVMATKMPYVGRG